MGTTIKIGWGWKLIIVGEMGDWGGKGLMVVVLVGIWY